MKNYKIYLAGKFVSTDQTLKIQNPHSGETFAETCLAGETELETAIQSAEKSRSDCQNFPIFRRFSVLRQIADRLAEDRDRLAKILATESGKPLRYALGEIDRGAQTFLVAAEEAKRLPAEFGSVDWTVAGAGRDFIVKNFPAGIIAGIAPFNFPLNLAAHKIAPAIAAGCPIILKPASSTPLSTLELAKIIQKTDLPPASVSILPMDRATGNRLVIDDRFAVLSFTGSPEIGWKMKRDAGKKKVILELGGNAGVIVAASADLDTAVAKCLVGAFAYSGQVCIHAQRIFVHESIFDKFSQKFIVATKKLKIGDPLDPKTEISAMIDEKNAIRIENWVREAVDSGAKILAGGKRDGTFFEPTILTDTKNSMKVCALEAFGPIVVLEKFKNFDHALDAVNDSKFGLQAGVFTDSRREAARAFHHLEVGGVILNDIPTFRVDHTPYGGVKDSGLGREGVKYAIQDFLEPRVLIFDRE